MGVDIMSSSIRLIHVWALTYEPYGPWVPVI